MGFVAPLANAVSKAGPLISLVGGISQGIGRQREYGVASDVSAYNQQAALQNADLIERAAAANKVQDERKKRARLSSIVAKYGASGVQLSGSPLMLLAESAANLELDVQNNEYNSLIDAKRARNQATIFGYESKAYKSAGRTALFNSILQSGSKFADTY